jgi:hypothetical protein
LFPENSPERKKMSPLLLVPGIFTGKEEGESGGVVGKKNSATPSHASLRGALLNRVAIGGTCV